MQPFGVFRIIACHSLHCRVFVVFGVCFRVSAGFAVGVSIRRFKACWAPSMAMIHLRAIMCACDACGVMLVDVNLV